jgi:ribosomal protein S9
MCTGRAFVRAEGKRKNTIAITRVYAHGTGVFTIDGQTLDRIWQLNNR